MWGQPPLWLKDSLVKDLQEIGATSPTEALEAEVDDLLARWNAPNRAVKNSRYLARLFERLGEIEGAVSNPSILRVAAAYQGAKLDPLSVFLGSHYRGKIDSAVNVPLRLQQLGVPDEAAKRLNNLIEVSSSGCPPKNDFDAQILADANLAVLALTPQSYSKMCRSLQEYAAIHHSFTERRLLQARREYLQHLLLRYRLFRTPFAARWEQAVRENLEGELSKIDARLAKLPAVASDNRDEPTAVTNNAGTADVETTTGPIVIRGSRPGKKKPEENSLVEKFDAQTSPLTETGAPKPVLTEPKKKVLSKRDHADDTSTLEMFDGLFSHRRPPHK